MEQSIQRKRELASVRWGLTQIEVLRQAPGRAVLAAESDRFGPSVLKIDSDRARLAKEHRALAALHEAGCCRPYGFDAENGLLLEERILPGTTLREESRLCRRAEAFQQVFCRIHREAGPYFKAESYLDWLGQARKSCAVLPSCRGLARLAAQAEAVCERAFAKYPERLLLHGDLHHENILLRPDGSYAAVDPKGVVGPAVLELPRYIYNEPGPAQKRETVARLSAGLGYPARELAALCFMESVLANVWRAEDGEAVRMEEIAEAEELCRG